jgi:hypothetical protein
MFRAVISDAMTPDIKKMVYQVAKGIPKDDDAMIEAVKEATYIVENIDEEIKGPKKRTLEVRENRHTKEAAHPHEMQQKDRKVKDKDTDKKGSSGKKDKKSDKPAIFASGKEALQHVPQSEIDKHKKDKANCWRCRHSGHKMYECYAKKTVGGTELSGGKIASLGKRKQDDEVDNDKEQEKSKGKDKKAKTAAVHQDEDDIDLPDAQPRIWELEDSDEGESDI